MSVFQVKGVVSSFVRSAKRSQSRVNVITVAELIGYIRWRVSDLTGWSRQTWIENHMEGKVKKKMLILIKTARCKTVTCKSEVLIFYKLLKLLCGILNICLTSEILILIIDKSFAPVKRCDFAFCFFRLITLKSSKAYWMNYCSSSTPSPTVCTTLCPQKPITTGRRTVLCSHPYRIASTWMHK